MKTVPVPDTGWDAKYDYVPLCTLPVGPQYLADEFGIHFSEDRNNLGTVIHAFVKLGPKQISLAAYPDGPPEARLVHVGVPGDEREPQAVLALAGRAFDIADADLRWKSPLLEAGRWILCRIDDDGNEIEVDRFLVRCIADNVAAGLEATEPGQTYLVKAAGD